MTPRKNDNEAKNTLKHIRIIRYRGKGDVGKNFVDTVLILKRDKSKKFEFLGWQKKHNI